MAYCSILEPIAYYELPTRFLAGSAFFAPAYLYVEERDAHLARGRSTRGSASASGSGVAPASTTASVRARADRDACQLDADFAGLLLAPLMDEPIGISGGVKADDDLLFAM
jgi:hypothetical protein